MGEEQHKIPVSKEEYEALAAFRFSGRRFLHFSEEAASQRGLSPRQYQALVVIAGYPRSARLTVSELAERLLIRPYTAVELVNRLETQKLVQRVMDEQYRLYWLQGKTEAQATPISAQFSWKTSFSKSP
ncbi:MAG TPA: helix-turn-helix domain-containing protein [Chloroflexia bacterium]|nr:helix-turn-helix domain-containing protein [Chloroflexia bacterium]